MMIGDDDAPDAQASNGAQAEKEKKSDAATETEDGSDDANAETESGEESDAGEGDDEAEGDEGDGEEGDEGDDGDKPEKPKKASRSDRYKRRIERLEAELRTRDQSTPLRSGSMTDDQLAARVEEIIGKPPKEDDFKGDYIGFERAMNAYEVDKRQTAREVKKEGAAAVEKSNTRMRELVEDHQERVEEFRTKVAKDFNQVVSKAKETGGGEVSPTVESLVLESDQSAHIVYYLAKNPAVLDKLNGMTEREAAREIGRIESRLSLPNPKTKTSARDPVKPLKGGATPSSPERDLDAWLSKQYGKR